MLNHQEKSTSAVDLNTLVNTFCTLTPDAQLRIWEFIKDEQVASTNIHKNLNNIVGIKDGKRNTPTASPGTRSGPD